MPQNLVAIDVSRRVVRVAVVEASLRHAELVAVHTVPRGEGEGTVDWQAVRAVLPAQVDSVVVGMGGQHCSTRLLEFPAIDPRKGEAAIDFELEGQIPYDLGDVATSWTMAERTDSRTSVLAALTPRAPLVADLAALATAGLEPRGVMPCAGMLPELVPTAGDGPVAILSLGESDSHLVIAHDGLRYLRTLRAGGEDIDRALAQAYRLDLPTAKQAKESEGRVLGPDDAADEVTMAISNAVAQGLGSLVRELTGTLRTLPASQRPVRVQLTGGLSRLPGLAAFLSRALQLPVELLDVRAAFGTLACRLETVGPEMAPVVAMALALVRHGRLLPLNFRRGELAYRGDLQLYRGHIVRLGVGVAALFVLGVLGSLTRYVMLSSEEKQVDRGFCTATQRIVGKEICNPTAALATLRQAPGSSEGVVIPSYSAAVLFDMMSRAIDPSIDVTFDEMEIRVEGGGSEPDRITARGEAGAFETTEQVVAALKRDPCVQEATVSKQRKTQNTSRVEFSLAVKVACPPGAHPGAALQTTDGAAAASPEPVNPQVDVAEEL